jgi:hypothetical protein
MTLVARQEHRFLSQTRCNMKYSEIDAGFTAYWRMIGKMVSLFASWLAMDVLIFLSSILVAASIFYDSH